MEQQTDIFIFLSYANEDQDKVIPVYDFLVKSGFPNAWMDCKKILPGQPWEIEIQRNLKKSEVILFFLSNFSVNKRGFIQRELKRSLSFLEEKLTDDIYLIPIKLDKSVIVPEELTRFQTLDLNEANSLHLLKQALISQTHALGYAYSSDATHLDEIHVVQKKFKEVWEGLPGYEVEFSIPVIYSTKYENIDEVTKIIESSFLHRLHHFRGNKIKQVPELYSWAQNEYQRTDVFEAIYKSLYHKNNFLSIMYQIYWYGSGAAHPNHDFNSFNFLLNPLIQLDDISQIFEADDKAFLAIQCYVRKVLLEIEIESADLEEQTVNRQLLEKKWVDEGTTNWDSFQSFIFSEIGLVIYFAPYQVGSYATGSHQIAIPYKIFHHYLNNDLKHALGVTYIVD